MGGAATVWLIPAGPCWAAGFCQGRGIGEAPPGGGWPGGTMNPEADSEAKWEERQDMAGQIRGDGDVLMIPLLRGE